MSEIETYGDALNRLVELGMIKKRNDSRIHYTEKFDKTNKLIHDALLSEGYVEKLEQKYSKNTAYDKFIDSVIMATLFTFVGNVDFHSDENQKLFSVIKEETQTRIALAKAEGIWP